MPSTIGPLRVAVIDIGTNSTRLLLAEADGDAGGDGRLRELERQSRVTGLGRGLETSGLLAEEAIDDVAATVADYLERARAHDPEEMVALATSAVRDAGNGGAFLAEMRERFALAVRTISGAEEAELSWLGAVASRPSPARRLVLDIGGGSTELIVGTGATIEHHTSLQLGVVRHTERYLRSDPPEQAELEAMARSVRAELEAARAAAGGSPVQGIALAGTPASLAAIELGLDPYDGSRIEGYELSAEIVGKQLSSLAGMPLADRAQVVGLHPDRAPMIVAGALILAAALRTFGLERITVSERDILWGAALRAARR